MSLEGWIFMVGLRVFDVGGLIVWLVWFFKLRDEDEDADDDDGGGNDPVQPREPDTGPGSGLPAPLPDAHPWPTRRRGHGDREPVRRPERRGAPLPVPAHERPARPLNGGPAARG